MWSSSWLLPLPLLASLVQGIHHVVKVGENEKLEFVPETLKAAVGDTVEYQFFSKNHSVVQSSFDKPCQPLEDGFFSGFVPTSSPKEASRTTFTINIKDTKPRWVYCSQGSHCQSGMVHGINVESKKMDEYKREAAKAKANTSPKSQRPAWGFRRMHVDVGKNGKNEFTPNDIKEIPGTIIQFNFCQKNHSAVESSFDKPCVPVDGGFSSGFIPVKNEFFAAVFNILVQHTRPVWFYDAKDSNCKSGMVGSINAPSEGNTLEAYAAKASKIEKSEIPDWAPIGGVAAIDGLINPVFDGPNLIIPVTLIDPAGESTEADKTANNATSTATTAPTESAGSGEHSNKYLSGSKDNANASIHINTAAGGSKPGHYAYPDEISDDTIAFLQVLKLMDRILGETLYAWYKKIAKDGEWEGIYPNSLVAMIQSMSAQISVHYQTLEDTLNHFDHPSFNDTACKLKLPEGNEIDEYVIASLVLLKLEIGALADVSVLIAQKDSWFLPALVTEVGAKSRMSAVINMIQNKNAAAAPREVLLPVELAWSYAMTHFVESCSDQEAGKIANMPEEPFAPLEVVHRELSGANSDDRALKVTLNYTIPAGAEGGKGNGKEHWVAWVGPWGTYEYTKLDEKTKVAEVPENMFGYVWIAVVNHNSVGLSELEDVTVAGPQIVWTSNPQGDIDVGFEKEIV
ncbi:hypothetical protein QBC32DRAFT_16024 [Pseudoneurospora amorphoporcata]|uniref:Phytocyanin domain-containing protein n=1 Tax=Pseudoneurospora amorphoporcata TaxID=241081 RepID=A0AAN6P146_9PEZI|nr:hypothetical protein QBC32DRAFT_16024 [Pseudoneurospora amorphoporcata]